LPQPFSRNAPAFSVAQFGEGHILIGPGGAWGDDAAGASGGRAASGEGGNGEAGARGGVPASSGRGAPPGDTPEYESLNALTRRRQAPAQPPPSAAAGLAFQGMSADVLLTDAMEAVGACLGTPRAESSGASLDGLEDATPPPDPGQPLAPPDAHVLAEELRKEGVRLVKAGQAAAAEIVYTEAIKYAPRMHMLYSNRAACYARLGRHADALADARACVSLAPQACRGHWQEALALEAQGRYGEALEAYERACRVAREAGADPALQREYEARRESLRRTTASQQDAAARVARILAVAEAERSKEPRGLFGRSAPKH
jgi:tetratricopeptide (TPR) repeat protein